MSARTVSVVLSCFSTVRPFSSMDTTFVLVISSTPFSASLVNNVILLIKNTSFPHSGSISTTVTFLPISEAISSAPSRPEAPPPQITIFSPFMREGSRCASKIDMTLFPSIPGIGGVTGTAPHPIMMLSHSSRIDSSPVISVFRRTSTPSFSNCTVYHFVSFLILFLNFAVQISPITPPSFEFFSNRVTLCPSIAATLAASIPPGPPPITTTFFGESVFLISNRTSSIACGLIAQLSFVCLFQMRPIQYSLQRRQGLTSSGCPVISLLGRYGSAINARPMFTKSTFPLSINSTAESGL